VHDLAARAQHAADARITARPAAKRAEAKDKELGAAG